MRPEPVFVDTSGWVALFDREDRFHRSAADFWVHLRDHRREMLTSDYVLDEAYTLLRRTRNGLANAIACYDLMSESILIETTEIDVNLRQQAWRLFCRYDDKVLSFTDCTSFALMRQEGLLEVFGFDQDFERAGFVLRP